MDRPPKACATSRKTTQHKKGACPIYGGTRLCGRHSVMITVRAVLYVANNFVVLCSLCQVPVIVLASASANLSTYPVVILPQRQHLIVPKSHPSNSRARHCGQRKVGYSQELSCWMIRNVVSVTEPGVTKYWARNVRRLVCIEGWLSSAFRRDI